MRQDIRGRLIQVARNGEIVFYSELGIGRGQVAGILGDISEYEHSNQRPLLTAVVANKAKGMPSPGFWEVSAVPSNLTDKQRPIFWARELIRVIEYWQSHPNEK